MNIEQAVFEALGAASMCWSEPPTGEFDSARAEKIGEALLKTVREAAGLPDDDGPTTLAHDLAAVLNKHNMENGSNTPDFVLADYLIECLVAFDRFTKKRERWYGHQHNVFCDHDSPGGH